MLRKLNLERLECRRAMVAGIGAVAQGEGVNPAPRPWHNAALPSDVNRDNAVTPLDALLVISELNRAGARPLDNTVDSVALEYLYDVSGDGSITPLDALKVIMALNAPAEHENVAVNITPEQADAAAAHAAAQMQDVPEALEGKFNLLFWDAFKEVRALALDRFVFQNPGLPLSQVELQRAQGVQLSDAGQMLIQFDLDRWDDVALASLEQAGLQVVGTLPSYHRVVGWLDILQFDAVGELEIVGHISFPERGRTR